ncbi:hypothetical protein PTSG_03763 [Salpingoeca rosetta]|uniref:PDZ domain-containing protein n=1 Tax=Salpingoeca rosetta (strain ATCC 50818 / BSB-021) TaxID=946362 RepID=F2U5B0_SALR5|nr:uncharacterized protein PTSG_03763 [Salpingoeca rosetta]EGD83126.1 hypothetical protein PTSG_03763 [Salpingoeca rosetta]|eukprot:XP_004995490.1 hypothetical protein PTSG_03763 [Salpingoeca rosetta]
MGGGSSRQLDELDVAIFNLKQTSESFRERATGAIDMMSNRLDDLEKRVTLLVRQVRGDPMETDDSTSKYADALHQLTSHDDVLQSAMYEAQGMRYNSTRSQHHPHHHNGAQQQPEAAEDAEDYQFFRKDSFRVEIFSKRHDVTLRREPTESFGLTIVAAQSASRSGNPVKDHAIFIKAIKPGAVADRDGRLRPHDRVLAINGIDVSRATHEQVMGLVSASGREVTLTVAALVKVKRRRKPNDAKASRR